MLSLFLLLFFCEPFLDQSEFEFRSGRADDYSLLEKRETIYIVINDEFKSQLLKDELTRDWTKTTADLSLSQKRELDQIGLQYNLLRDNLKLNFVFLTLDQAPIEAKILHFRFHKHGEWEPIDKRAFLTTTYPLKTIEYVYKIYYEDRERLKLAKNENENRKKYLNKYNQWRARVYEKLKTQYPEKNVHPNNIYCIRKTIGFLGWDDDKERWVTLIDPEKPVENISSKIEEIMFASESHQDDQPYSRFHFIEGEILSINFYSNNEKKYINIKKQDLGELSQIKPPDKEKPLIYQKPLPPWEHKDLENSVDFLLDD